MEVENEEGGNKRDKEMEKNKENIKTCQAAKKVNYKILETKVTK